MQIIFEQIRVGGDRNFGYLLADRDAKQAILIDPSYSPKDMVERATVQGLTVTHVLNTHGHPDHTNGNRDAVELTGASVGAHTEAPSAPDIELSDEKVIAFGELHLKCFYVPGHSQDHLVFYEAALGILLTGDLLFVGKVGGTNSDDDARSEWESLQRLLRLIPDQTTIWPGHDYGARPSSTMDLEKRTNPFLRCADADAFLRFKSEWPRFKSELGLK